MHTIERTYTFSAAHIIPGHPKCGRMHGHNYKVEVSVTGELSGPQNWIMDFGELDKIVKPLIDRLDHRFIKTDADELARSGVEVSLGWHVANTVVVDAPSSSAESLAELLGRMIDKGLEVTSRTELLTMEVGTMNRLASVTTRIRVEYVTIWETERSSATWSPS